MHHLNITETPKNIQSNTIITNHRLIFLQVLSVWKWHKKNNDWLDFINTIAAFDAVASAQSLVIKPNWIPRPTWSNKSNKIEWIDNISKNYPNKAKISMVLLQQICLHYSFGCFSRNKMFFTLTSTMLIEPNYCIKYLNGCLQRTWGLRKIR